MVQKIKDRYKLHTHLCKDTKGHITGDKKEIKGRWDEHFKEILNKNKHTKKKAAAIDIQQNQMNIQSGEMGIQAQTKQETQLAIGHEGP